MSLTSGVTALERFERANRWLLSLIRADGGATSLVGQPWEERVRRHRARQTETAEFLKFVGRPQDGFRSVAVVGTSGKGTVTAMIAATLVRLGFRVADHTSPYLQLPTEKMRLDGRPIGPGEFADAVDDLRAHVERWRAAGREIRYGQAWAALVMLWMARVGCDFGIYEASVGGRFSNAALLHPDVAVITNVGLDHLQTLGPSLDQVAWHKAGVAAHARTLVTGERGAQSAAIITAEAAKFGTNLIPVSPRDDGRPPHVVQNEAVSIAAVRELGRLHGFDVPETALEAARVEARLPGRFEEVQRDPLVILDGAHNADKVRALARSVASMGERGEGTLLFGVLGAKAFEPMLELLAPHFARLVATEPRVYGKPARAAEEVADHARRSGWNDVEVARDPAAAVTSWLDEAAEDEFLVVSGSMYLAGEVRERWFPRRDLLIDGNSPQGCHNP